MQIAIDVRLTHYTGGGISRYMRELVARLPALDVGNHYSLLHMSKAEETLTSPKNARRVNVRTPAHHWLERWALATEVAPLRPALLHSPDFIPPVKLGWKSVITIHDLTFLHYPDFLTRESRRYYNRQIKKAVKVADAIVTDSEATRQDVLTMLKVPAEKVTTVHLAQNSRFVPASVPNIAELCQRLGLPQGFILFVGTFEPRKNIDGLLRAYATLPDAPPLVLAGRPGWKFEKTEALIAELDLSMRVKFVRDLPDADLPTLYSAARMLVLPSHYEGFGLPVLEAMACGTPTIIANRASLPEIAGRAAMVIEPDDRAGLADAIQVLLHDETMHADLVRRGRTQAMVFSWERCAAETLAVYRRVLGG